MTKTLKTVFIRRTASQSERMPLRIAWPLDNRVVIEGRGGNPGSPPRAREPLPPRRDPTPMGSLRRAFAWMAAVLLATAAHAGPVLVLQLQDAIGPASAS